MNIKEIINNCISKENAIILPSIQIDRKTYMEINKLFELHGGKWDKKSKSHIFSKDTLPILESLKNGEKPKDLKKDLQQFYTPNNLAKYLCDNVLALTFKNYIDDAISFIEPSAGRGAIAEQILTSMNKKSTLTLVEIDENNIISLKEKFGSYPNVKIIHDDILNYTKTTNDVFDIAIMNPPFNNAQDIEHIQAVGNIIVTGGMIGSITTANWQHKTTKKYKAFKEWLDTVDEYNIEKVQEKAFKESGTNIPTQILYIQK